MNGAFFNPEDHSLNIYVDDPRDLNVLEEEGCWIVEVRNLKEGIEIYHEGDRLWRPV